MDESWTASPEGDFPAVIRRRPFRALGLGRTLDRYVALRFLAIYLACLASFVILYVLIDSVAQVGALSEKSEGFLGFLGLWFRFYAAQVPIIFCRILGPVTSAASAGFAVTFFQRSNELTPVMAAGISLRRLLAPVLALTLLSCAFSALVQEVWIPMKREAIKEARSCGRGTSLASHVKYFDEKNRVLVTFLTYNTRLFEGTGIAVLSLDPRKDFLMEARRARWDQDGKRWILEDGFLQRYDRGGELIPGGEPAASPGAASSAQGLAPSFQTRVLQEADLLPQDLESREGQESYLWLKEIRERIASNPDAARWRVRLLGRLLDPFHSLILVLLGIPTILGRGTRNVFLSAIATMVISGLYFVCYVIFLNLGNTGLLPPTLAAGLAPLAFGALGVTMYVGMRS